MAPANDAVFLRRNNQIQDAIDGQNLKQALQLIEKRMKKGEDTRFLKAWKANVLARMPDEAHHKRGVAETIEICQAEPPTTDMETLEILSETLKGVPGHTETRNLLWEKAVKAKPQDLELTMQWFTFSFEGDEWKAAQKASMSLQKNFPHERKYYFWAIFCSYMISKDANSSEVDRKLFGTLAYRMISKAASDVPSNPSQPSTQTRAIQTSEELLLLVKIFESQSRFDEVVKILSSDNVGIGSRICQNDTEFVTLKAMNLGMAKLWEGGIAFVKERYSVPEDEEKRKELRDLDDWNIWNLLTQAVKHIDTPGALADARKFTEDFIAFSPKSRNAALARLDIIQTAIGKGEMTTESDLVPAFQQYIDQHKEKTYAFGDLRRVSDGDRDLMKQMLEYLSQKIGDEKAAHISTINCLKLDYCLNISGVEKPSKQKIDEVVTRCMRLYHALLEDDKAEKTDEAEKNEKAAEDKASAMECRPRDDLCVLAAMAVLSDTTDESGPSHTSLLKAAAILNCLTSNSPHNYNALLMLVRIYLALGAGSLAFSAFNRMAIKQMQYEAVAHNFFTRLASIHPHSTPPIEGVERKDFDPQAAFIQALNFYRNADITTMKFRSRGLEEGSYRNIEEIIELRSRFNRSFCRRLHALEARRAQRLVGGDPLTRFDEIARSNVATLDYREYTAFMNCEFDDKPPFEERLRLGPIPKDNWLSAARVTDQIFSVLKGIALQKPLTPDMDMPDLSNLSISDQPDQTDAEKDSSKINAEILKLATFMAGSKATTLKQAEKSLSTVEDWLNQKKINLTLNESQISPFIISSAIHVHDGAPTAASWEYLHPIFTLLETIKALVLFVEVASRKSSKSVKLPKEPVDRLATLVPQIYELVRSNTRALKQRISASGVLSSMVDLVVQGGQEHPHDQELQQVLESALGASDVELFCGELMESWEEALDGVMGVKP